MTYSPDKPASDEPAAQQPIPSGKASLALRLAGAALVVLIVLVRVVFPGSDAYSRLTWSSALLTDEGFYIHNARNLVLFGHARTDEFNNALIMPLLHLLQVAVFRVWGVGAMQARALTIGISLLTLLIFWDALRRAWGQRCAWLGLALLGLDPVFALYNRLALMDTPACLPLCLAFWMWVRAKQGEEEKGKEGEEGTKIQGTKEAMPGTASPLLPLFLCGVSLGLAYCVRGLTAIVVLVPVVLLVAPLWQQYKQTKTDKGGHPGTTSPLLLFSSSPLFALFAGLALVLLAYVILWYLPNRIEMAHVNRFYLHEQLLPRSMAQLGRNAWSALAHRHRGVLPFLLKHSPVLVLLNGYWFWLQWTRYRRTASTRSGDDSARPVGNDDGASQDHKRGFLSSQVTEQADGWADRTDCCSYMRQQCACYLAGWLLMFLVFVSVVDYAPSRYYVMFYPALAGLAASALDYALGATSRQAYKSARHAAIVLAALWVGLSGYWYADWMGHLTYRQRDADAWLATHLPANSVLLGAVAPGLCLNNRFQCVNMIENLCNDHAPVERFAPAPRYIVILDTDSDVERSLRLPSQRLWANRWKEKWWIKHYPTVVRHDRRIHAFPHMIRRYFTVGVYAVPVGYKPSAPPAKRTKFRIHPPWRDSVSSQYSLPVDALLER